MNNLTWHCNLILQNDEEYVGVVDCLRNHVMNRIYHDHNGHAFTDQKKIRIYVLAKFLRAYIEEITDFENENSYHSPMTCELILGALQEIDFRSIAEDLIGDYSQKTAEEVAESEEYFNIMGFANYDIDEE